MMSGTCLFDLQNSYSKSDFCVDGCTNEDAMRVCVSLALYWEINLDVPEHPY